MTQEEADNLRNAEFPEFGPQTYFRMQVDNIPKLHFTVAQNMYYETMMKTWKVDISAIVFNRKGERIYTAGKANPRPASKSMKYYPNIRDRKLKVSDDIGLKLNLAKLEADAHHVIVTVDIKDLNGLLAVAPEFAYARVRVSDFLTDQTLNESNLNQEFNFETLKDAGLEEEAKQSSTLICYYLYRTADFGWMLESVRLARNTSGENGLHNLQNQLSQLIIQGKENDAPSTLVSPRTLDKPIDEPIDIKKPKASPRGQEKNKIKEEHKQKEDHKNKDSKEAQKGQDKGKQKEEEITQPEVVKAKLVTRTFGPVDLILFDSVEVVQEKVIEAIRKEQAELLDSFEFGYEIYIEETSRSTDSDKED